MDQNVDTLSRNERLVLLGQSGRRTAMGTLLRRFWQPVALSKSVVPSKAKRLKIMGEELTLYRGQSGRPYLVAGRCAHRLTLLHTGWVEGEEVRCIYHGWKYDGAGQCVERPAEDDDGLPKVRIAAYPLHEYCGLVFAYLGEGAAPAFDLPRKSALDGADRLVEAKEECWPCNWFQMVENSMDAVHVSFVHQAGKVGPFGEAVSTAIPKLEYLETDAGIRQIATRSKNSVRISDWTFPNNNHISRPFITLQDPWLDVGVWMVPVDDESAMRFTIYATPSTSPEADKRFRDYFAQFGEFNSADHHAELFDHGKYPEDRVFQLTSAQDYVATVGQGTVMDRASEYLGASDAGIAFLRRIFWRELDALRAGRTPTEWRRLEHEAELPIQAPA
ncbi:MAG TPA: Rieske 2Fe-2S domain-containing protein [Stellaceae bacterium]|nr:Rieske 2Fe-2S domain-containing protein [Stellaceae bacterium]